MIDTDTTNVIDKNEKIEKLLEEVGEEIHNITGIDEFVIGCALSNYGKKNICAYGTHGYCKDLLKCESVRKCVKTAINNLFGCLSYQGGYVNNEHLTLSIKNKLMDKYICDLTIELDKLANMDNDDSYLKHYILVDKSCIKDRVLPIRVPGYTVGGLWFDENYCITKIHIDSKVGYTTKPYPENVNELMQKYIGRFLAIENMEEKNNDK